MLCTVRFLQTLCKFIFYYIYMQYIHLISVTLLQNDQNGEQIQKSQTYFFCFNKCKYGGYLLNQHRQLISGRNVCGTIFC